jgi:hypothetical protein
MKIVVARYKEDISWTNQYQNVVIYNKGSPLGINNEIMLDNVGREGHTYYRYICDNYDNLDEYTVFLQGNPVDHYTHIMQTLSRLEKAESINEEFRFLTDLILSSNLENCPHHKNLPLKEVYKKLFNQEKNNMEFVFGAGALFLVSKTRILKRPKEFYEKIVKLLEYDINPIEGFVIERFHGIIFGDKIN